MTQASPLRQRLLLNADRDNCLASFDADRVEFQTAVAALKPIVMSVRIRAIRVTKVRPASIRMSTVEDQADVADSGPVHRSSVEPG
jgi:hypothetical protein